VPSSTTPSANAARVFKSTHSACADDPLATA
jgi:hypothetical protein